MNGKRLSADDDAPGMLPRAPTFRIRDGPLPRLVPVGVLSLHVAVSLPALPVPLEIGAGSLVLRRRVLMLVVVMGMMMVMMMRRLWREHGRGRS